MAGTCKLIRICLIDGLSCKFAKTASYVNNRRSCTFYRQWSNIDNPNNGTKLVKFLISRHDWLDPSTLCVTSNIRSDIVANQQLRPSGGPRLFPDVWEHLQAVRYWRILICIIGFMTCFCMLGATGSRVNAYGESFLHRKSDSAIDIDNVDTRNFKEM